jgi:tetratricopeptide (TPR) repeat protein
MVHAHLGNHAESLESLEAGRALIDDKQIQSSIADTVINALGAICCASGAYEVALRHFTRAYQMRTRIGNDWTRAVTAANAALCCGRLGQYERQVEWSAISMKLLGPQFTGLRDIQAATYHAMGLAMTGKSDDALRSIDWLDQRICCNERSG